MQTQKTDERFERAKGTSEAVLRTALGRLKEIRELVDDLLNAEDDVLEDCANNRGVYDEYRQYLVLREATLILRHVRSVELDIAESLQAFEPLSEAGTRREERAPPEDGLAFLPFVDRHALTRRRARATEEGAES